jgi:hypothetical protein
MKRIQHNFLVVSKVNKFISNLIATQSDGKV